MKDITIIVKTMDRYECLKTLLKSILSIYKEIPILIGDDGKVSCKERVLRDFKEYKNIQVYDLPYDTGLSYGRNFLVHKVKTKYVCLCDDDFVFDRKTDLIQTVEILKKEKLDILGGYIRNYKIVYSFKDRILRFVQKMMHYELRTNYIGSLEKKSSVLYANYRIYDFPNYEKVDIVMNFFIAKTKSLKECGWDEELKLQEHTAFFYKAKRKGLQVAFTNQLSVRHCPIQNKKYKTFRTRNYTHVFMEKEGISKIVSTFDDTKRNTTTILPKINNILISVVVPVYNAKGKIDLLIKSLKEQTYKNFEVIFVDNNSIDGSFEYIKKCIGKDKRFSVIKEEQQGPNYARKKGFQKTKGDYVYFCDADDYLEDDTFYHFVCEITKNKSDIVIGNYIEHRENDRKIMKGVFQEYKDNLRKHKDILHVKPAMWNKIFKRELIDDDSFVFTLIGEDMFITVLSMIRAKKITYIDKIVYHYLLEDNGLSSKVSYKNIVNMVDTQNAIKENLEKTNNYKKWKEEVEYIFITHLVYRMFRITLLQDKEERNRAYKKLKEQLNKLPNENKYLHKSKAFSIAYKIVCNRTLFTIASPFIKLLFTNKLLNRIFKKLDR